MTDEAPKKVKRPAKKVEPKKVRPKVQNDMDALLPSFRKEVEQLLKRMERRGFEPMVFETGRTEERAEWLKNVKKTSKVGKRSMHCHGAAVDIICAKKKWDNKQFFRALGQEAAALKLTWGGSWGWDRPHVQAIPVGFQDELRALPCDEAKDAFCQAVILCRRL